MRFDQNDDEEDYEDDIMPLLPRANSFDSINQVVMQYNSPILVSHS